MTENRVLTPSEVSAEAQLARRLWWFVGLGWFSVPAFLAAGYWVGLTSRWGSFALFAILFAANAIFATLIGLRFRVARREAHERVLSALSLLESMKAEWEAALDSLHELVVITDLGGRVLRANQSFARAVGSNPRGIAGRLLSDLLARHPDRWWTGQNDGIAEIEDPIFDTLFEITVSRLEDRIIRIARDVGEQRRLYARLVQADKMAAVGVLAGGVAHEVNNPTAFVIANLTELKRYVTEYEGAFSELSRVAIEAGCADHASALMQRSDVALARREALHAVADSLQGMERIRQIAANLRVLAGRDQAGESSHPVSLGEVVQAVVRTAASDLRADGAKVEMSEPLWVVGHRSELVDVVLNLVVNAIQARQEGRPNRIAIDLFREETYAVVRISDTGKGITPAHLKRLFEPFFTTKPPGEGTGLGLSLARNIVLAHGGSIDVSSQVAVGSTFTIRLPVLDPEATEAPAVVLPSRAGNG